MAQVEFWHIRFIRDVRSLEYEQIESTRPRTNIRIGPLGGAGQSRCLAIGHVPQIDLLAQLYPVVTQDRVSGCHMEIQVWDNVLN